jgi:hypothetical protein
MMKTLFTTLFVALFALSASAQDCRGGYCSSGWNGNIPDDGNNTLGQTYNSSQCGLNFVMTSHMITQRYTGTPTGVGLPATYTMQMPACVGINGSHVDKAYFWWGVSYNAGSSTSPTLTVTNPASQTSNYVASLIGTSGPKCWGEIGTRTFRADITSAINGNGNYVIDIAGNPVSEIDGGTLIIIYTDPAGAYTGTMIINDGCLTFANGTPSTITCANFNACQNSTNGVGFIMTGDQQNNISPPSHDVTVGSSTQNFPNLFWNTDVVNANVTTGAVSINLTNTPNISDCWSFNVAGYYFQTSCSACNPVSALQTSQSLQNAACGNSNGWAAVSVSGGQTPYTYAWSTIPVQNTATATGLGAGTYTCNISDASGCNFAMEIVTISNNPPPTATVTPAGPIQSCSGNPTVLHSNTGIGYMYQWYLNGNPIGGATLDSIAAGVSGDYTVIITDAFGCTATSNLVQVVQGIGPVVTIASSGGTCNSGVIVIGYPGAPVVLTVSGTGAVSYLWSTGATTQSITVTSPGIYTAVGYDANGCPSASAAADTVVAISAVCGHNNNKVILCHVPPGNPNNPQTICVAASAIPSHLANHPGDCIGPCSLYYAPRYSEVLNEIEQVGFFAEAYPNPSSHGFALHLIVAPDESVMVNIHDVTGRIVETYTNVTEQTQIGTKLAAGTYNAEVVQGENRQILHLVKTN